MSLVIVIKYILIEKKECNYPQRICVFLSFWPFFCELKSGALFIPHSLMSFYHYVEIIISSRNPFRHQAVNDDGNFLYIRNIKTAFDESPKLSRVSDVTFLMHSRDFSSKPVSVSRILLFSCIQLLRTVTRTKH